MSKYICHVDLTSLAETNDFVPKIYYFRFLIAEPNGHIFTDLDKLKLLVLQAKKKFPTVVYTIYKLEELND